MALFLVFVSCFGVLAADESGNVLVNTYSYDTSYFYFTNLSTETSWTAPALLFDGLSDYNFNRIGSNTIYDFNGVTRCYTIFEGLIDFENIFDQDFAYFTLELDSAVLSSNALIENVQLIGYDENALGHNLLSSFDGNYGITVNYQGLDFSGVNTFFYGEVSSLIDYSLKSVQGIFDVRLSSGSPPILSSPLTIKFFKNYQDVVADLNNNVLQIINQNDIIINNLIEVKGQLNNIHNSLNSNNDPANPELDSNVSFAEDVEKEFTDRFNDFIDPSFKDDIFNKFNNVFLDPKFSAAMIFVRDVFDSLFFRVPILGILFAVGGGAVLVAALFGITSRAFSDRVSSPPPDQRVDIYKPQHFSSDRYHDRR